MNATTVANANTVRQWQHGKPRRPMKNYSTSINASSGLKLGLKDIEEQPRSAAQSVVLTELFDNQPQPILPIYTQNRV
jgi:hypothetical protein